MLIILQIWEWSVIFPNYSVASLVFPKEVGVSIIYPWIYPNQNVRKFWPFTLSPKRPKGSTLYSHSPSFIQPQPAEPEQAHMVVIVWSETVSADIYWASPWIWPLQECLTLPFLFFKPNSFRPFSSFFFFNINFQFLSLHQTTDWSVLPSYQCCSVAFFPLPNVAVLLDQ